MADVPSRIPRRPLDEYTPPLFRRAPFFNTQPVTQDNELEPSMGVDSFSGGDTGLTPDSPTEGAVSLGGTLNVSSGGTGAESLPTHNLIVGRGTSTPVGIPPVEAAFVLTDNGPGVDPSMQAPALQSPDVAHSGTGVDAITAHGIVVGRGTSPIVTVNPVEAGFVLTDNGPGNDPSMQAPAAAGVTSFSGGTTGLFANTPTTGAIELDWATGPGNVGDSLMSNGTTSAFMKSDHPLTGYVPDMATWLNLQAANAGTGPGGNFANWIWGDYVAPAPIVVNILVSLNDWGVCFYGARITPGFTNTTQDVLTFTVPNSVSGVGADGFTLSMVTVFGVNGIGTPSARNCIVLEVLLNANAIFGGSLVNVHAVAAGNTGILFYGSIFEMDNYGINCRDCGAFGAECRNPTQGGGAGVISSINFHGGDLRTNKVGLGLTADTTFQEPTGVHVMRTNFIANNSWGIFAFSGIAEVVGCHMENNCNAPLAGEDAGISTAFGYFDNCDAAHISSNAQVYLLDMNSGGANCFINQCDSINESIGGLEKVARLQGSGVVFADAEYSSASFQGDGSWTLHVNNVTTTTI